MHIKKIDTDILLGEGIPRAMEFGQRTFIVGGNGAGKTRAVTALSLLVSQGTAYDLLGHSKASKTAMLLSMAPAGSNKFDVLGEVEDTDRTYQVNYGIDASDGKMHHGTGNGIPGTNDWSLPVALVAENLWLGPDKAHKFFLPFLTRATAADIERRLPEVYNRPEQTGERNPASVTELLAAIENAKQRAKSEADMAEASTTTAQQVGAQLPPFEPTEDQLNQAKAAATAARALATSAAAWSAGNRSRGRLAELEGLINEWGPKIEAAERNLPPPPTAPDQTQLVVRGLAADVASVLTRWQPFQNPTCPCCGTGIGFEGLQRQYGVMENLVATLNQGVATYDAQVAWRAGEVAKITQAKATLAGWQAEAANLRAVIPAAHDPQTTEAEANMHLEAAENAVRIIENARGQYAVHRDNKNRAAAAKQAADWWKGYAAALLQVGRELFDVGLLAFRDRVQKWLPPEYRVVFVTRDNAGAPVFRPGLDRNGNVHLSLSGAQKLLVEFAVAAACLELLPEAERPRYALFAPHEERVLDSWHGGKAMRALEKLPWQVVLYSIERPTRPPKSWSLVEIKAAGSKKDTDKVDNKDTEGGEGEPLPPEPEAFKAPGGDSGGPAEVAPTPEPEPTPAPAAEAAAPAPGHTNGAGPGDLQSLLAALQGTASTIRGM